MHNASGHYECRWVRMRVEPSPCQIFEPGTVLEMPVGHGEGKFVPGGGFDAERSPLVALRYVDEGGNPTLQYPDNPNGSAAAVAGLTDPTGRVFGLMPHPDRSYLPWHHPQHLRKPVGEEEMAGALLFRGIVAATRG